MTQHRCAKPRLWLDLAPRVLGTIVEGEHVVELERGELWKCLECRQLYKVTFACDYCEHLNGKRPHRGTCTFGLTWRPTYSWRDKRRWKKANR